MGRSRREKVARVQIHGKIAHNAPFLLAIGGLVVNWSNCESVFLAMLQALVGGGTHTAAIIWQAQRTPRNRLELISKLAHEQVKDNPDLVREIDAAIKL